MGEQTFLGKFMVGSFYMGPKNQIMQWESKNFTNTFSNNLNTVILKVSHDHGGRHTFKEVLTSS